MLKEWPLVAFTILGQTAVGAIVIVSSLLLFFAEPGWDSTPARPLVLTILEMALVLLGTGAAVSFFHLRFPFRARRVLANWRTSRLSREILSLLALMGLVVLADVLIRTGNAAGPWFRIVMGASVAAAVLFLASMAGIYALRTVPAWEPGYVRFSFGMTACILGAMATAWIVGAPTGDPFSFFSWLWGWASFATVADVVVELLETPVFGLDRRPSPSLRPPARAPRWLHFGRLVLLVGGAVILLLPQGDGTSTLHPSPGPVGSRPLLNLALALVFAGAAAGRFLFYGLVPRPGD
jgi:Tat-targeted selenate reductase subunit YnfH